MSKKKWISWIVSQDGETMVIVILFLIISTLISVVYGFNEKLDKCTIEKFELQMEYTKRQQEESKEQAERYEEKIQELTELYNNKLGEVKEIKKTVDKTIKETKNEINKY